MFSRVRLLLTISIGLLVLAACGDPVPPETGFEVAVTVVGDGNVTSTPEGINTADGTTSATFAENAEVVLTAAPIGNATFTNWTGGACDLSTELTCTIADLTADTAVTANFTEDVDPGADPLPFTVEVVNTLTSDGTVTSDVGGIACPGVCEGTAPEGSDVVLTAVVTTGGFVNWTGGDCDGQTGLTCTVTVNPDEETVTANFGDVVTDDETVAISGVVEELVTGGAGNPLFLPGFNYVDSGDLDFGFDTNANQSQNWVGMRFSFVELPADANVQSAVISMTATDASSDVVNVTISGEAVASPGTFMDDAPGVPSSDASTRAANSTTATVAWDITEAWTGGDTVTTPDLESIVSEIVAIDGWAGDLVIFVSPDSDLASLLGRRVNNDATIEMAVVWTTPVAP